MGIPPWPWKPPYYGAFHFHGPISLVVIHFSDWDFHHPASYAGTKLPRSSESPWPSLCPSTPHRQFKFHWMILPPKICRTFFEKFNTIKEKRDFLMGFRGIHTHSLGWYIMFHGIELAKRRYLSLISPSNHGDFMEFYNFEVNLQNLKKIWKFPEIGVPPNHPFWRDFPI